MKILLCGGGTGGHITPNLAIAHELKKQDPDCILIYVGEHGGKFAHLIKNHTSIDTVSTIYAGKLRRYNGEPFLKRLVDIKTILLNLRDLIYVIIGFFQSLALIIKEKPDIIFLKGGYVGLPIGLAAAITGVPYITHDSDVIPSLTNKIVGKWAVFHTTGMQSNLYNYPKDKVKFVGIPVADEYQSMNDRLFREFREEINIPLDAKMLLITGGSLGAFRMNKYVSKIVPRLLDHFPDLYVIHQMGKLSNNLYSGNVNNKRLRLTEFIADLYRYSGAADLIITRGGANSIAELAIQGKASIVIPNPQLTGGHQVKNGELLTSKNVAVVLDEKTLRKDPDVLYSEVVDLLSNKQKRNELAANFKKEGKAGASKSIAMLLLANNQKLK